MGKNHSYYKPNSRKQKKKQSQQSSRGPFSLAPSVSGSTTATDIKTRDGTVEAPTPSSMTSFAMHVESQPETSPKNHEESLMPPRRRRRWWKRWMPQPCNWWPCRTCRWMYDFLTAFCRVFMTHYWLDQVYTLGLITMFIFGIWIALEGLLHIFKPVTAQSTDCSVVYVTVPGPIVTVSLIGARPSDPNHATYYYSVISGTTHWLNSIAPPTQFSTLRTTTVGATRAPPLAPSPAPGPSPSAPPPPGSPPSPSSPAFTPPPDTSPAVPRPTTTFSARPSPTPNSPLPPSTPLPPSIPSGPNSPSSPKLPPPVVVTKTMTGSSGQLTTATTTMNNGPGIPPTPLPPLSPSRSPSPPGNSGSVSSPSTPGSMSNAPGLPPSPTVPGPSPSAPGTSRSSPLPPGVPSTAPTPSQAPVLSTRSSVGTNGPTGTATQNLTTTLGSAPLVPSSVVGSQPSPRPSSGSATTPLVTGSSRFTVSLPTPSSSAGGTASIPQTRPSTSLPTTSNLFPSSPSPPGLSSTGIPSVPLSTSSRTTPSALSSQNSLPASSMAGSSGPSPSGATTATRTLTSSVSVTLTNPLRSTSASTGSSLPGTSPSSLAPSSSTWTMTTITAPSTAPPMSRPSSASATPTRSMQPPSSAATLSTTITVTTSIGSVAPSPPFVNTTSSRTSSSSSVLSSSSSSVWTMSPVEPSGSSASPSPSSVWSFAPPATPTSAGATPTATSITSSASASASWSLSEIWGSTSVPYSCSGAPEGPNCPSSVGPFVTREIVYSDMTIHFAFPEPDITTTKSYWTGMYPSLTGPDWTSLPLTTRTAQLSAVSDVPPLPSFEVWKPTPSRSGFKTVVQTVVEPWGASATPRSAGLSARQEIEMPPEGVPVVCGESGNFTVNFDDSVVKAKGGILPVAGMQNPYHHLFYANGFTYVTDNWEPYPAMSQPNVAMFLPLGSSLLPNSPFAGTLLPGELGAGPRASVDAYWFDAFGGYFGCALNGITPCTLRIAGYRWDAARQQEVVVAEQNVSIPPCWGYIKCRLVRVDFDARFRALSGIQFKAYTHLLGIPQIFFMDALDMGWWNNTCSAGILRIGHS